MYFPGFSPMLLTTQKSKLFYAKGRSECLIAINRVLIASIRSLARCPCPRCFVTKDQIDAIGTKVDARRREDIRIDDDRRRAKVELTRGWIFESGTKLNGAACERVLAPTSMTPTRVCFAFLTLHPCQ